ncbi:MAG: hypothetical protein ABIG43_03450 [Chloroflexota bacterium]
MNQFLKIFSDSNLSRSSMFIEIYVTSKVRLIRVIKLHAMDGKKAGKHTMQDCGTRLALYVIADDW